MLTSLAVSSETLCAGKWYLGNQDQLDLKGCWHSSLHPEDGDTRMRGLGSPPRSGRGAEEETRVGELDHCGRMGQSQDQ